MLPVPVYNPGGYPPPGKQFVQFGDDVLANTLQEAHDKIAAKRDRMVHFHHERLQKHGLKPMRDAAVQAVAHTSEVGTGPEQHYAAEPQHHSERGHGFLDSVAHGGAAGARHGWGVSKGLGQMVGYVGGALASSVGGAMVGVGQGAVNHMLHGTPNDPEEEGGEATWARPTATPPVSAAASAPASSSTTPMEVEGLARPPMPKSVLNHEGGRQHKLSWRERAAIEHRDRQEEKKWAAQQAREEDARESHRVAMRPHRSVG